MLIEGKTIGTAADPTTAAAAPSFVKLFKWKSI
jgi:hypothetical protein